MNTNKRKELQERRHRRVRAKVKGTKDRPRLSVFRSNRYVKLQLIDDIMGKTIVAMEDKPAKGKKKETKEKRAEILGEEIAKKAIEKGITAAVFDRGGYLYHGIIKAVAEGARKGGLTF